MSLPIELWQLIVDFLFSDPQSVSRLCCVNREIYTNLLPLLYNTVHMSKPPTVSLFCNTMLANPRKFAALVHCIKVGDHFEACNHLACPRVQQFKDGRLQRSMGLRFRSVLELLYNLQALYLSATPAAMNQCLNDLKPPFKVRHLAISCVNSTPMYVFLRGQYLVTHLHIFHALPIKETDFTRVIRQSPCILPRLRAATTSTNILIALSTTRNLSEVVITDASQPIPYPPPEGWEYSSLLQRLNWAGITSLGWFCSRYNARISEYIIKFLKSNGAHKKLKKLTELHIVPIDNPARELQPWIKRLLQLVDQGSGFDELKFIEITLSHPDSYPHTLTRENIASWLGEFQDLSSWVRFVPSLRQAHVFGIEI